jgi:hypothetical protein
VQNNLRTSPRTINLQTSYNPSMKVQQEGTGLLSGRSAWRQDAKALKKQKKLPALRWSDRMAKAA